MDLSFGLRKEMTAPPTADPESQPKAAEESPAGRKRRLWGALLALDVIVLLVFAGAVAGLGFIRWSTPPLAEVGSSSRIRKTQAKRSHLSNSAPVEGKPIEATKSEQPAEPKGDSQVALLSQPQAPAKPERPTGSPSVHAAALPARKVEPLGSAEAGAAQKAAPPAPPQSQPAPGPRPRARSVEFSHSAPSAREVFLKGPFLVRTGGKKLMVKDSTGVWRLSLSLLPGDYKYSFIVNGQRTAQETMKIE